MMKKHLRIILSILAALLLALFFASKTSPTTLEAARARWEARPFTRYHLLASYTHLFTICTQDLIVEAEQVLSVQNSVNCDEYMALPEIRYPTITDIFDYLQAQAALYARQTHCQPQRQVGVKGVYDNQFGYPVRAEIGWIFSNRLSFNPLNINSMNPQCIGGMMPQNIIEIVSLTPE